MELCFMDLFAIGVTPTLPASSTALTLRRGIGAYVHRLKSPLARGTIKILFFIVLSTKIYFC